MGIIDAAAFCTVGMIEANGSATVGRIDATAVSFSWTVSIPSDKVGVLLYSSPGRLSEPLLPARGKPFFEPFVISLSHKFSCGVIEATARSIAQLFTTACLFVSAIGPYFFLKIKEFFTSFKFSSR